MHRLIKTEAISRIYSIIERIKFMFSLEYELNEDDVNAAFNDLFEAGKAAFDGEYRTAEAFKVLFDELNIIADNHIRKRDTLSFLDYMIQCTEMFANFVNAPNFSDSEKLPVKQSFLTLKKGSRIIYDI